MEGLTRRSRFEQHGGLSTRTGNPAAAASRIHGITYDRVADMLQMDPDLVGAARMQLEPQEIDDLEASHNRRVGAGGPPLGGDRHAFPIANMASHGGFDPQFSRVQVSPGKGGVASPDPPSRDRRSELAVSEVGLGDDHQARGVAVQPMYDAGPPLCATRQGRAARDQRIDERIVPVPWCRMDDKTRRFIDNGEMLVLEDEREWNGSRADCAGSFVPANLNSNRFAAPQNSRCAGDFSIDGHPLVGD